MDVVCEHMLGDLVEFEVGCGICVPLEDGDVVAHWSVGVIVSSSSSMFTDCFARDRVRIGSLRVCSYRQFGCVPGMVWFRNFLHCIGGGEALCERCDLLVVAGVVCVWGNCFAGFR